MRRIYSPAELLLKDSTSSACANPTTSNSLGPEQPLDYETNLLVRRLLISIEKSNHSRQALTCFESESRNTDGVSGKQLKKRPMFLDPPGMFRNTGTRRKKKRLKEKRILMKHRSSSSSSTTVTTPAANPRRRRSDPSHREWCDCAGTSAPDMNCHGDSSSNYHDGGSTSTSWKQTQEGPGRRRAMSPCPPPSPPVHPHQMPDIQQCLDSIGSSFDVEDNDLLMLEPIELSEAVPPPEIEQIELKKRLSYEDQRHAHQQQPEGWCFGQMRSNTDNYSSNQPHHHPQHQHQQHFAVTMHHHQQSQNNNPRYYPNAYPGNDNNADKRKGWSWSFHAGMHY
jgi:hypothetical protein